MDYHCVKKRAGPSIKPIKQWREAPKISTNFYKSILKKLLLIIFLVKIAQKKF